MINIGNKIYYYYYTSSQILQPVIDLFKQIHLCLSLQLENFTTKICPPPSVPAPLSPSPLSPARAGIRSIARRQLLAGQLIARTIARRSIARRQLLAGQLLPIEMCFNWSNCFWNILSGIITILVMLHNERHELSFENYSNTISNGLNWYIRKDKCYFSQM